MQHSPPIIAFPESKFFLLVFIVNTILHALILTYIMALMLIVTLFHHKQHKTPNFVLFS